MIHEDSRNLEKSVSFLRSLWLAMEHVDLGTEGVAYFPDAVEVAGDLVQRSIGDLWDLYDGRIPDP